MGIQEFVHVNTRQGGTSDGEVAFKGTKTGEGSPGVMEIWGHNKVRSSD